MFELNIDEYDESSDDIINELDRMKKTDTIAIKDIMLNPLNTVLDTEEDIKIFADKIYHNPAGVIENVTVYRTNDGKYMLLSGHKRILACKYNIDHEDELDGSGNVQKTVFATIVKKPENKLTEINSILDYNDYRRLERFEQKYEVFLKYYLVVALMMQEGQFKGRIREYISTRSGLGLKVVGECIKVLQKNILDSLIKFQKEINNNSKYTINDKYRFVEEQTNLPMETIKLVMSKLKDDIHEHKEKEKNKKENNDALKRQLNELSTDVSKFLNAKTKIAPNNKITIQCGDVDTLNDVLKRIGYIR